MSRSSAPRRRVGHYRWVIVALLFAATVDQLYRPADDRRAQADAAWPNLGWSEIDLRQHRLLVPDRLRDRLYRLRPARRPDRRAARLCARLRDLDASPHIAHGGVHQRDPVRDGALRARHRRSGQLPGRHQGGDRMVPGQGARLRDRHVQRRRQYRRDRHAAGRALPGRRLWLARRLRHHRRRHLRLAVRLAGRCTAARASTSASPPAELAYIEQDPADPGRRRCPGAGIAPRARPGPMRSASSASIRSGGSSCSGCPAFSAERYDLDILPVRPAAGRHLPALRRRLDRRRLAVLAHDQGAARASITRAR